MDATLKKLDLQIDACLEKLSTLKPGTDEEVAVTTQLGKLIEMRDTYTQKKDRSTGHIIGIAGLMAQLGFGMYGMYRGMCFEEKGYAKSTFFKEWRQRFRIGK